MHPTSPKSQFARFVRKLHSLCKPLLGPTSFPAYNVLLYLLCKELLLKSSFTYTPLTETCYFHHHKQELYVFLRPAKSNRLNTSPTNLKHAHRTSMSDVYLGSTPICYRRGHTRQHVTQDIEGRSRILHHFSQAFCTPHTTFPGKHERSHVPPKS